MSDHINSASRLVALLRPLANASENSKTIDVWAQAFGLKDQGSVRQIALIAECLNLLYREVDVVRSQMGRSEFSNQLYAPALERVERALSILHLHTTWNNARQYLTPDVFVALSFCVEIMPDEESVIDPKELAEIKRLVDDLSSALSAAQLPERIKRLIEHHIDLIHKALAEYKIIGAKAFRDAGRIAIGELVEVRDSVKESMQDPAITKLGKVWGKVNEMADFAIKADRVAKIGRQAWEYLESALK